MTARSDKNLSDEAAGMVLGYYEADTLAERIFAELIESASIPETIQDISIHTKEDAGTTVVTFACPVNDRKELLVELEHNGGDYAILVWKLRDTADWDATTKRTFISNAGFYTFEV